MLTNLNAAQQEAVRFLTAPLLIVAGAGSGKTLVLTQKIAYLCRELNLPPEAILAITFTNKAAKEMKSRTQELLAVSATQAFSRNPYISTFHAFCADVLRQHFQAIGGSNQYTIIDSAEQTRILKGLIQDLNLNERIHTPQNLAAKLDDTQNRLLSPQDYSQLASKSFGDHEFARLYDYYQKKLWQQKSVDFGGLLFWTVKLLEQQNEILMAYQKRFRYLLVDEYQDTNHAQYRLIKLLAGQSRQITVVGDFDQNIYSWRGANIQNILNFEKDFPGARTIMLEQNYRSTKTILSAANALIEQNQLRKKKNLWTENTDGNLIIRYLANNEQAEGSFIAEEIMRLKNSGQPLNSMVILYRVNALSRVLEEQLAAARLPYQIIGGQRFFERKEIKDIIAYLRLIYNFNDDFAFTRICNIPARQLSSATVDTLSTLATQNQCSIFDLTDTDQQQELRFSGRPLEALLKFWGIIKQLKTIYLGYSSDKVGRLIKELLSLSGYQTMLEKNHSQENRERLENIYEFISLAREEELGLGEFLNKVSLFTDMDTKDEGSEHVTLMTLHNAKGLEFDTVFIAGMEEGIFPHYRCKSEPELLEEERRLCYVGLTRARQQLYLTHCQKRLFFGDIWQQGVSRFINELPPLLLENKGLFNYSDFTVTTVTGTPTSNKALLSFQIGEKVQHPSWGTGTITHIDGGQENMLLHIRFLSETKKLMAKYAPLSKCE